MAETQVVTVVFTDLVGSTQISSRLDPDSGDRLRQAHFALLREATEEHGGIVVKNLGDGLMLVFSVTSAALNCAEEMQQAITRHNRQAGDPMIMRVGLSLGEVTCTDGDYFGDAVIEAARLCALAAGGQILATQNIQLTAGRRARQQFVDLGDVELKGLPEPVATVEVKWKAVEIDSGASLLPLPRRCEVPPAAGFVGRSAERALLSDALKEVTSQRRHRLVMIGGEPGIGKTSLATECARNAFQTGATALFGRADEELSVPYGPWADALSHLVSHAPKDLRDAVDPHMSHLVRLAPQLAALHNEASASPTTNDPEAARYMLFNAVIGALAAASEFAPVVLVLDDLQWADTPSLLLLRHVAKSDEAMRLLVIGTFRESEVALGHPLSDLLGDLHRERSADRISLKGLDDLELLAMMEAASGQRLDEDGLALRDALVEETDGNPFFAGEMLRHLVETGALYQVNNRWVASSELRDQGLPVSVREVIGRRVARLGEAGSRVLSIASVIGRDFELSVLGAASGIDEDTLLDVMDRAEVANLVDNIKANRYTFVHALIQHTIYESLSEARRAHLHRDIAEALEAQASGRTGGNTTELAHHWARATSPQDRDKAVRYAQVTADAALARLAPTEAMKWYSQALDLLDDGPEHAAEVRCALLVGLGVAQRHSGNPESRQTLLDAAELARSIGATDLLVAAALENSRGIASIVGSVDRERVNVLELAAEALEGSETADTARVLALLGAETTFDGDVDRRKDLSERAISIARRVGDKRTLASVLKDATVAMMVPEMLDQCLQLSHEALEISNAVGDPVLRFRTAINCALFSFQSGLVEQADQALEWALETADTVTQPDICWLATINRTCRAILSGDCAESERLLFEAADIGGSSGQLDALTVFGGQLSIVRIMQGRSDEIVDVLRQVADDNPAMPVASAALAMAYCDLDRKEDARALVARLTGDGFQSFPHDQLWLSFMCALAYSTSELGLTDVAKAVYEMLFPFGSRLTYNGAFCMGDVDLFLGQLATTLGSHDQADRHFASALATHERIGASWCITMTKLAWGRSLAGRGAAFTGRASGMLDEARQSASDHGYGLLGRRAHEALHILRGI